MINSPETSSESTQTVVELMDDVPFSMLTTFDAGGELVSRPMSHQEVEPNGDLWFICSRKSRKVEHIRANPKVAVVFASSSTWVSVNGFGEVVDDSGRAAELWSKEMEAWFPQGPEDESIVCLKVTASTAEYWDTPGGRVSTVLSFVRTKLTGKRYTAGDNEVVDLSPTA